MNINETASALAFSRAAADYDEVSIGNPIVQKLRARTQRRMLHHWHGGNRVLELNCGTGADALFLAEHGIAVLATDISPAMIERTQEKIAGNDLERVASTRVLAFEQISELNGTQFDGALSMFGGLNCTKDIANVFRDVATLLPGNGIFLASFLGKYSLWEVLAYTARLNFRKAFRRWRHKPLLANVYDIKVPTFYWSVAELMAYASPYFTLERIESWSALSPPPASLRFLRKHKNLSGKLFSLEEKIAHKFPFNRLGDHVILELKKK